MTNRPESTVKIHCRCGYWPNACRHLGYCVNDYFLALDEVELAHCEIVRAVRQTAKRLTNAKDIKPSKCRDWLNDEYRDAKAQVIDGNHDPVDLNMECFDPTDEDIDNDRARDFDETLRDFFRGNACTTPRGCGRVFVTERWHSPFITMASVVGVSNPELSRWWPRIIDGEYVDPRVANDNHPIHKC